jgi:hypothetical protein
MRTLAKMAMGKGLLEKVPSPMEKKAGVTDAASLAVSQYHRIPQPESYVLSADKQSELQRQMYGTEKTAAVGNPPVTIPRPAPVPRMRPQGPSVGNIPQIQRDATGIGMGPEASNIPGQDALKEKKAFDPAIATLLAGGAGGLGGYMAGKHMVDPLLANRETNIAKEIAEKEKTLGNIKSLRRFTPIGMAALGAVALAALAASKARSDERRKMQVQQMLAGHLRPYDPTDSGYGAADQVPVGAPYEQVFG